MAGGRVTREANTRARRVAKVAKHHGLNVDGGTQILRNALAATVDLGALSVPRTEHRFDCHVHLVARILREGLPRLALDDLFVGSHQGLPILRTQFRIRCNTAVFLELLEGVTEEVTINVEDGLAEHLDEAAVGIPRETLIGVLRQSLYRLIVEADVKDGFHHAGHGELGAGTNRNK